jgi:hypothetical protein
MVQQTIHLRVGKQKETGGVLFTGTFLITRSPTRTNLLSFCHLLIVPWLGTKPLIHEPWGTFKIQTVATPPQVRQLKMSLDIIKWPLGIKLSLVENFWNK